MRFKFELDIGVNEVIRLGKFASEDNAKAEANILAHRGFPVPRSWAGAATGRRVHASSPDMGIDNAIKAALKEMGVEADVVHLGDVKGPAFPPAADWVKNFLKGLEKDAAHIREDKGPGSPAYVGGERATDAPQAAQQGTVAPGQKPGPDAVQKQTAILGEDDFPAVLYALQGAIERVDRLGPGATNPDLIMRLHRLNTMLRG